MDVTVSAHTHELFLAAMRCEVSNGQRVSFWHDRWLLGRSPASLPPHLLPFVHAQGAKSRTVAEARLDNRWVRDIRGTLSVQALVEYLGLWAAIQCMPALTSKVDLFSWRLTTNGYYSPSAAYKAFFFGSVEEDYANSQWKNIAPPKEKFFCWLVMRDRCWTTDRLAKRGLDHPPVRSNPGDN